MDNCKCIVYDFMPIKKRKDIKMEFVVHKSDWDWGRQVTIISTDGLAYLRFHIEQSNSTLAHFTIVEVHPSVRGYGRMKEIWFFAKNLAKDLGCTSIIGYSNPLKFIHNWYIKHGMKEIGLENGYMILIEQIQ